MSYRNPPITATNSATTASHATPTALLHVTTPRVTPRPGRWVLTLADPRSQVIIIYIANLPELLLVFLLHLPTYSASAPDLLAILSYAVGPTLTRDFSSFWIAYRTFLNLCHFLARFCGGFEYIIHSLL